MFDVRSRFEIAPIGDNLVPRALPVSDECVVREPHRGAIAALAPASRNDESRRNERVDQDARRASLGEACQRR